MAQERVQRGTKKGQGNRLEANHIESEYFDAKDYEDLSASEFVSLVVGLAQGKKVGPRSVKPKSRVSSLRY